MLQGYLQVRAMAAVQPCKREKVEQRIDDRSCVRHCIQQLTSVGHGRSSSCTPATATLMRVRAQNVPSRLLGEGRTKT